MASNVCCVNCTRKKAWNIPYHRCHIKGCIYYRDPAPESNESRYRKALEQIAALDEKSPENCHDFAVVFGKAQEIAVKALEENGNGQDH